MNLVSARAGYDIDLSAQRAAVLRRENTFDDVHLFDRLNAQKIDKVDVAEPASIPALRIAAGLSAIHRVCGTVFALTVEADTIGGPGG